MVLQEPLPDSNEVWEGEIIQRSFKILNKGDKPLEIKKILHTCGCTTVGSFNRIIPPGGEETITVSVNTKGFKGPVTEKARLYTNDPGRPEVVLTVKAFVKPVITLSRRYVNFYGKEGEKLEREVEIVAEREKPLKLTPLDFNLKGRLTYEILEIKKGKKFRVRLESIPGKAGNYRGFLKFRTNYAERPEITIWIWGRISS
ncbi:MAG: DUF1573 domain-containing protein [Deltaproteobacteria bacterium]|nr:DUF1573 domain-containing protein [Deltaproteobacteria bacterium]